MTTTLATYLDYGFELAASIVKDDSVVSGYRVQPLNSELCTTKGVVYLIVENDAVIKIGGSGQNLLERWTSYAAGTKKARDKGTCSVTNYDVSQYIRDSNNTKLCLYAYTPAAVEVPVNLFGKCNQTVKAEVWKNYEKFLLDEYTAQNGDMPLLSKNK
jgi:hypothetical protein